MCSPKRVLDLGQISMKCCIPVFLEKKLCYIFFAPCLSSDGQFLVVKVLLVLILSLLPNSQLSCKTGRTELFQSFWTLVANLPAMGIGECHFLPRHRLSLCQLSSVEYTPDLKGLELTFGFTKAGIAVSTNLVFSAVSVIWCAVVADDWDSLTSVFLGYHNLFSSRSWFVLLMASLFIEE